MRRYKKPENKNMGAGSEKFLEEIINTARTQNT
jgi:hypothetical protein